MQPISVDGRQVRVTENLEAALRSLRLTDKKRHMWVDALCINQADDVEKTHQVHLMAEIYRQTALALLWLGSTDPLGSTDSSEESSVSLDSDMVPIMTYRRLLDAYYDKTPRTTIKAVDASSAFELIQKIAEASKDHHFEDDENPSGAGGIKVTRASRVGLERLMCLSWWNRIWPVQEAVLPPKAIVFCGSLQLDWPAFVKAQENMDRHYSNRCCSDNLLSVDDGFRHMSLMDFGSRVRDIDICQKLTLRLIEALTVHCARTAGDPRDMLYALLGLKPNWVTQLSEAVNCSLPSHEAFCKMTMELIRLTESLEPLIKLRYRSQNKLLPTGVHDLSAPWHACFRLIASRYNTYNASEGKELSVEFSNQRELRSRGVLVDEIESALVAYDFDGDGTSPQVDLGWVELLGLGDSESRSRPYPTGGTVFEAFKSFVTDLFQKELPWDGHDLSLLRGLDYTSLWGTMGALDYTSILGTKLFVTKEGFDGPSTSGRESRRHSPRSLRWKCTVRSSSC